MYSMAQIVFHTFHAASVFLPPHHNWKDGLHRHFVTSLLFSHIISPNHFLWPSFPQDNKSPELMNAVKAGNMQN